MKLGYKIKPRDAKSNPTTAILAAVFVMFLISGLLLLLLALLLYKMEPGESVIKIGIVAVYVISGLCGGFLMGKRMREQKFLWGMAALRGESSAKKGFSSNRSCAILYGLIEFYCKI